MHFFVLPRAGAVIWPLLVSAVLLCCACGRAQDPIWSGYAEGDFVYVASPLGGRVDNLNVTPGQWVEQGATLFSLESESEAAAREEAAARLSSAEAQVADISKGKRQEEIDVARAQLAQAQSQALLARSELERQQQLLDQGFVARAHVDDAATAHRQAQARVEELATMLRVSHLPARTDQRRASEASADAARQALRQSEWRSRQKQQTAPQRAQVADVLFRVGEYVQPGQPVVSLFPPQNTKARFFVPQADLGSLHLGQEVRIRCDGCGPPVPATISRIATQPEFTPPVIYSNSQRSKLVFMVEARPAPAKATQLKPGQPLDVALASAQPAP